MWCCLRSRSLQRSCTPRAPSSRTLRSRLSHRRMPPLCQSVQSSPFGLAQQRHVLSTSILVLVSLPEGAWGNRLRFLQSGARGRSASQRSRKHIANKPAISQEREGEAPRSNEMNGIPKQAATSEMSHVDRQFRAHQGDTAPLQLLRRLAERLEAQASFPTAHQAQA